MIRGYPGSKRCRSKPWPIRNGSVLVGFSEVTDSLTSTAEEAAETEAEGRHDNERDFFGLQTPIFVAGRRNGFLVIWEWNKEEEDSRSFRFRVSLKLQSW
jgi:hypothetical protein